MAGLESEGRTLGGEGGARGGAPGAHGKARTRRGFCCRGTRSLVGFEGGLKVPSPCQGIDLGLEIIRTDLGLLLSTI